MGLSNDSFQTYARLTGEPRLITVTPRLASWDKTGSKSQIELSSYLDHVAELLGPVTDGTEELSLDLCVGFAAGLSLTSGGRDLDNYLYPIAHRLGSKRLASVSAIKHYGSSWVRIGASIAASATDLAAWHFAAVETRTSTAHAAWKHEIADQLAAQPLPPNVPGPIDMELCFRVSARRSWINLWKPAIDALGAIVGEGDRAFHPNDDRIVCLRMHRVIDADLGNDVQIGIWWRSSEPHSNSTL
jgi:hypothetical protein